MSGNKSGEYDIKELEKIFVSIIEGLEKIEDEELSFRSKGVIIKEMESVAYKIAEKTPVVQERVGDIMGGEVLKIEWLEKYDKAVADREARGEARGLAKGEAERKRLEAENERLKAEIEKLKAASVL